MNKTQSLRANLSRPDMINYCHENFFAITCPTQTYEGQFFGCPYYDMCRELDHDGITNYPLDYYRRA